jgi:hypothetical protein
VAPKSGMVSKIGGNTVIRFVPVNVGWPRGGERNRSKMGSDPGVHGPVGEAWWRPRPGKTTLRVPGTSAPRVVSNETANDRISLCLNFVSRPKFRVPLEIPTHGRSSYFDPAHYYFLFCYGGRRGGDGEQQYNLLWHDVDIFPPKMTKK